MSVVAAIISKISPSWARRRAENRLRLAAADMRLHAFQTLNRNFEETRIGRTAHDAASRSRLEADWPADLFSADGALLPEAYTIVARARAAKRNDWAARSAADAYRRHVVGTGITCRSAVRDPATDVDAAKLNQAIDRAWLDWCNDPTRCDIEGRKTFIEIQGMMIEEWFTTGESFLVDTIHPDDGHFCVAVYEMEQLARDHEIPATINAVRGGVEVDRFGKPVAYWFHTDAHPLEHYGRTPTRIPANRVHHLFRQERPRQTRGITRMACVLNKMRHLQMYDVYQMVRARVEACIALIITRDAATPVDAMGGLVPVAGTDTVDPAGNDIFDLEPGMVKRLRAGESITGFDPKAPGTTYEPFSNHQQMQIAAGLGLDRPTVARDFTNGSFSSQREGHLERDKETDPLQAMMIAIAIIPVRRAFLMWAATQKELQVPDWFFANPSHAFAVNVQPPPKQWIDPTKQAAGAEMAIRNSLSSLQIEANTLGYDWREMLRMKSDALAYAKELEIELPFYDGLAPVKGSVEPRPTYGTEPVNGNVRGNGAKLHRGPVVQLPMESAE